jgi:hypothetical protein
MKNPLKLLARLLSFHKTLKSKSGFVKISKREIFKYRHDHKETVDAKRSLKNILRRSKALVESIMWAKAVQLSVIWVVEAGIEGLTANFATHFLWGVPFTWQTVLAHGFVIKQALSVYHRLRISNGDKPKKKEGEF